MANSKLYKFALAFLVIFYLVGLIGLHMEKFRDQFVSLTWVNLLLNNLILFYFHKKWSLRLLVVFIIIFILSFFIEVIGVNTGFPFGVYTYGSVLGFKLFSTPMLIGLNWLMLLYCFYVLISNTRLHFIIKSLVVASLMLIYDIVLEPIAIDFNMWTWELVKVPLENYIAWFVIAFSISLLLTQPAFKIKNRMALPLVLVQFIFFTILNITK